MERGGLLDRVGHLVRDQRHVGRTLARAQENMTATRERARMELIGGEIGRRSGVHAHLSEIRAERGFQMNAKRGIERLSGDIGRQQRLLDGYRPHRAGHARRRSRGVREGSRGPDVPMRATGGRRSMARGPQGWPLHGDHCDLSSLTFPAIVPLADLGCDGHGCETRDTDHRRRARPLRRPLGRRHAGRRGAALEHRTEAARGHG